MLSNMLRKKSNLQMTQYTRNYPTMLFLIWINWVDVTGWLRMASSWISSISRFGSKFCNITRQLRSVAKIYSLRVWNDPRKIKNSAKELSIDRRGIKKITTNSPPFIPLVDDISKGFRLYFFNLMKTPLAI